MSSKQNSQPNDVEAQPPPETSDIADADTEAYPAFDRGGRPGQVFHFQRFGLSYGTDDKGHAASLVLSVLVLFSLVLLFVLGSLVDRSWIADALEILGFAFTFVAGVAVGKSSQKDA